MDDTILVATVETFTEAHTTLADIMARVGGALEWSRTYNSPLKYTKLILIDFTHRSSSKARTVFVMAWTPGPGNWTYFHLPDCWASSHFL
jgi:hypothetical protein